MDALLLLVFVFALVVVVVVFLLLLVVFVCVVLLFFFVFNRTTACVYALYGVFVMSSAAFGGFQRRFPPDE